MKFFIQLLLIILFTNSYLIAQIQLWSNPTTWGGAKPIAGQSVMIPAGDTILLDENTPALGGLNIHGVLVFAQQDLELTAEWIMVMNGELRIGTAQTPYTNQATITLTGTDPNATAMGGRGLMVMGGRLELHGLAPNTVWTKINAHAPAGSTNLTLQENVNWNVNDEIVIGPTDYYEAGNGASVSQRLTLTQVNNNLLTTNTGLNAFRWGRLQYPTNTGMSLTPVGIVTPPVPNTATDSTPLVLDERAAVGNLTRNIVIQAPNDALWISQGFGVHVMVMNSMMSTGVAHVNSVEFRRAGQSGNLGRYPFHWHMISYSGTQTLADATGQYLRNSTINSSGNRGIVIHGTNGVEVKRNIVYDVRGHGIFTEDAVERRNIIDSNLVLHVRNTAFAQTLKQHEIQVGDNGSSAFWISNPDNTITNNMAGDCEGRGFWLAFPSRPFGLSQNVLHTDGALLNPGRLEFGVFDNNTSHSNAREGIFIDLPEIDEAGNTGGGNQYYSTTDGRNPQWPFPTLRRFKLSNYKVWKNAYQGIWDRATWPDNIGAVSADNCGRFFAGSGADGLIERSLVVGTSLNRYMNGTGRPNFSGDTISAAFASYHSEFDIKDNIVINFPAVANSNSGTFSTNDYYVRAVDKGLVRNVNNLLINSHPGVKIYAPYNYFCFAGALWDPHGNWSNGIPNINQYVVYNEPFFIHGQATVSLPDSAISGGILTQGPYYGFNEFEINNGNIPWEDLMAINVTRLDHMFNAVGTWNLTEAGHTSWLLAHMRDFAAHPLGYYMLEFPNEPVVSDIAMNVENMLYSSDSLVLGVEYSGAYDISQVYITSWGGYKDPGLEAWPTSYAYKHVYQEVNSRQEVVDAIGGRVYWHDVANDMVWIKIQGGIDQPWNDADYAPTDDHRLYRSFHLRVYGDPRPASLPVELTDFKAAITDNENVELSWTTYSELNNDYFVIEHSLDGINWTAIQKIKGQGDSFEKVNYIAFDENPQSGLNYYRLQQVDFDKTTTYSDIVAIELDKVKQQTTIYPNPILQDETSIKVDFGSIKEMGELTILNAKGQVLLKKTIINKSHIDLNVEKYSTGLYYIEIKDKKGTKAMEIIPFVKG